MMEQAHKQVRKHPRSGGRWLSSTAQGLGEPRWRAPAAWRAYHHLSPLLWSWLVDSSSLTRRLQQHCRHAFRVQVLHQGWERPLESERRALGVRRRARAWVRQVHLLCDGKPWVYARTVIPAATLHAGQQRLARLGERPLGAMLFADRRVRRGPLEVARIVPGDAMHRAAQGGVQRPSWGEIWGRRSLFFFGRRPLLVSEIFLPPLFEGGGGAG